MSTTGRPRALDAPIRETDPLVLRQAMLRRLPRRVTSRAEVTIPPVPGLLEHYVQTFNTHWLLLGRVFSMEDLAAFRTVLKTKLEEAWAASPYAKVVVNYYTEPLPSTALTWNVAVSLASIESEYEHWVNTRTPPLFGKHADMKGLDLAHSLGVPAQVPILDVGAGTGRNTLPLARDGFPTDAVELAPALAKILREDVEKEGLPIRVFEGDFMDPALGIPEGRYRMLLVAEVVAAHVRDHDMLRAFYETSARLLPAGGLLLFSVFLATDGYEPDAATRELSQVMWSTVFTRRDLADAVAGLPLECISDESAVEYERARLPESEWPPTGWYEEWSAGLDLFDLPIGSAPFDLRWLVYRKVG